eukprot:3240057-Prorocentrum_lima.AAC.1
MGLFSIIIGQLVDRAAAKFPDAVITAYADDIIFVCDAKQAETIRLWIHHELQGHGISLNLDKTEVWKATATTELSPALAPRAVSSLKVVGSQVLGKDDVDAAMGFGDAALVLETCQHRLT